MPPNNPDPEPANDQPATPPAAQAPAPNPTTEQPPQSTIITPGQYSAQPYVGPPEPEPLPKKRRLPKILLIVFVILFVGLSGGAYAYWNILNNSPEKILADALSNTMTDLLARQPATTVGTMVYESKGSPSYKVTLDFDTQQAHDNFRGGATLRFEIGGKSISVKGHLIVIDSKEAYVKFDNLAKTVRDVATIYPNPEAQPWINAAMPFVQKIDGRWIKIDSQAVAETGLADSEQEVSACTKATKTLRIEPEDQTHIKHIFTENQFAIASEKLPKESVDGEDSFHYKLDLNERAGLTFMKQLVELHSFATVKKDCHIDPKNFDRELSDLNTEKNGVMPPKPIIELWVGAKTRRPTRLYIKANDKRLTTTFNTTVKINAKGVNITAPAGAMSLQDLLKDIQSLNSNLSI